MRLHHLFSFLGTVASYFLNAIGTTFLGIVLGIAFAIATGLAAFYRIHKLHGRAAMLAHWKNDGKVASRVAVICALVVYTPILLWKTTQAVYDDHESLVSRSRIQRSTIAGNEQRIQGVQQSDLAKYNELRISCAGVQGMNGQLQSQNRDQQNNITTCMLQQKEIPLIRTFMMTRDARPGVPRMEYLLTTNVVRTPAKFVGQCDLPIADSDFRPMSETGSGISSMGKHPLTSSSIQFDMTSPAWTPAAPLWVTMFFTAPVNAMPHCTFAAD